MEPEGWSPYTQEPATCPWVTFLRVPLKPCVHLSSPPYVSHVLPISVSLILKLTGRSDISIAVAST
jgi:hypothetical protein